MSFFLGGYHSLRGLDHMYFDGLHCVWKYLSALEDVNPGHVSKFPFLIALSCVDLTGNPAAACIYLTRDSMLGRS